MKIEVAQVVGGTLTPTGDSTTGAQRCVLALTDGSRRAAVVKFDSIELVAAECFCALLLQSWGLNVPDAFIVDMDGKIGFASADAGYPNLLQKMSVSKALPDAVRRAALIRACAVAAGFRSTALAVAADEAIGNRDRHLGNILWDGQQEAWIDHAFAVGNGEHLQDRNQLAQIVRYAGTHEKLSSSAIGLALAIDPATLDRANDDVISAGVPCNAAQYVADRLPHLADRLLARFPAPSDLLSNA